MNDAVKDPRTTIEDLIGKPTETLLEKGNNSEKVKALQTLLYELGFGAELEWKKFGIDGGYGEATTAAVKLFAQRNGSTALGAKVTGRLAEKILARYDALEALRALDKDVGGTGRVSLQNLLKQTARTWDDYFKRSFVLKELPSGPKQVIETTKAVAKFSRSRSEKVKVKKLADQKRYIVDQLSQHYGPAWRDPRQARKEPPAPKDKAPKDKASKDGAPKDKASKDGAARESARDFYVNTGVKDGSSGVAARLLGVSPVGQELEYWCWAATTEMMIGYLRSSGEKECPTCGRRGHHEADLTQGQQMNLRLGDSAVDCSLEKKAGFDYKSCDRGGWPYFFEFEDSVVSTKWAARRYVLEEHGLALVDNGPRLRVRGRLSDWQLRSLTYGSGREFKKRLDNAEGCALSWEMLTGLLDAQRPVAFTYRYPSPGAGHMRLAVGYAVTPGGRRWVAVADPLPPGSGEVHLIPYEYYRDGPFGGHWRDYWVPPAEEGEGGAALSLRRGSDALRVGRELVASHITYAEDRPPPTDGQKLGPQDLATAYVEAQAGLEAVKAIAANAKELAVKLGMGGAFVRGVAQMIFNPRPEAESAFEFADVGADDLKLNQEDLIPVYELTVKELVEAWQPEDDRAEESLKGLLDRPREIIYAITRPGQRPLTYFAAVTVRREKDHWQLASLGRFLLMTFFGGTQYGQAFGRALSYGISQEEQLLFWLSLAEGTAAQGESEETSSRQEIEAWAKAREQLLQDARAADRTAANDRADKLEEQLKALRAELSKSGSTSYPERMWAELDVEIGPNEDVPKKWEQVAEWWEDWWQSLRERDFETCKKALEAEFSRRASWVEQLPFPMPNSYRTGQQPLLDLVQREEDINRLCGEWSGDLGDPERKKVLKQIFEKTRDQKIEWLWRRFSKKARKKRDDLEEERARNRPPSQAPKPKYILSVPELYQLLVAYPPDSAAAVAEPQLDDEVAPVYDKSFHRPEKRVEDGTLLEVLRDLQDVANEREVRLRAGGA